MVYLTGILNRMGGPVLPLHVLAGGSILSATFCMPVFKRKILDNIYLELKMSLVFLISWLCPHS